MRIAAAIIAVVSATPFTALADGPGEPVAEPQISVPDLPQMLPGGVLRFTAGVGVQAAPGYFGSDETVVGPTGSFSFEYLRFGDAEFGTRDPNAEPVGLSFGGSVRFVAERSADEYPELIGLEDLDLSLELGAGLTYTQPSYEAFANLRYGVIGHESLVAEAGMDLFLRPSDRLTLSAGPRVLWGSDDYADTYFGVSSDGASAFDDFDAQGGLMSAGIEIGADYQVTDTWGVEGTVRWDRFLGDAADSPIVQGGSEDSVSASIIATRRFTLEF